MTMLPVISASGAEAAAPVEAMAATSSATVWCWKISFGVSVSPCMRAREAT